MPEVIAPNQPTAARRQIIVLNAPDTQDWVQTELIPRLQAANSQLEILTEDKLEEQHLAGRPWMVNIEDDVARADKVLFVLSPGLLPQQTTEYFFQLAYFEQKVITATAIPCTPPGRMSMLTSVDMTVAHPRRLEQNWERLIQALA